jgi:hypothetical protein
LLLFIVTLPIPNILDLIRGATFLQSIFEGSIALANVLLLGFLLAISVILLVQALVDYRYTHDLDRQGAVTQGWLMDKWVDVSGEQPVYRVRYKYLTKFQTVQTVSKEIFQQLQRHENVPIRHLEQFPQISRLESV